MLKNIYLHTVPWVQCWHIGRMGSCRYQEAERGDAQLWPVVELPLWPQTPVDALIKTMEGNHWNMVQTSFITLHITQWYLLHCAIELIDQLGSPAFPHPRTYKKFKQISVATLEQWKKGCIRLQGEEKNSHHSWNGRLGLDHLFCFGSLVVFL